MGFSPWVVGQTHIPLEVTWTDDSNNPVNLTNATISVVLNGPVRVVGAGTPVILNAANGQFSYQFAIGDILVPGSYTIQFIATYNDGTLTISDPVQFLLLPQN